MSHPEKLATQAHQDEETQNKNTTQYMLDTTLGKQTQITYIRNEPSYKQLKVMYQNKTKNNQTTKNKQTNKQTNKQNISLLGIDVLG